MTYTHYVKEKQDHELLVEFRELENSIYNIKCFNSRDLILLHLIGVELEKRGYICEENITTSNWRKEHNV